MPRSLNIIKKMKIEKRKKEIKQEMKIIIEQREKLRYKTHSLQTELNYMNGHFDKTWEEKYGDGQ